MDLEKRELVSLAERGTPNFVQDPDEETIRRHGIPGAVLFRGADGRIDAPEAVSFDTYASDHRLTDPPVFDGDGSLVTHQAENSRLPAKPRSYGPVVPYASADCPPSRCRGVSLLTGVPPEEGGMPERRTSRLRLTVGGLTAAGGRI